MLSVLNFTIACTRGHDDRELDDDTFEALFDGVHLTNVMLVELAHRWCTEDQIEELSERATSFHNVLAAAAEGDAHAARYVEQITKDSFVRTDVIECLRSLRADMLTAPSEVVDAFCSLTELLNIVARISGPASELLEGASA